MHNAPHVLKTLFAPLVSLWLSLVSKISSNMCVLPKHIHVLFRMNGFSIRTPPETCHGSLNA